MTPRRVGLAAAVAVLAAVSVAPSAWAAQRGDAISATVPPGSKVSPEGRYYRLDAGPAKTVTQHVRVTNTNDHAVTVDLEAVDGTTSDATGVAFGTPGSPKALTSRWIVVSTPRVTLTPDEQRDVPFSVHVPRDTKPGQYLAALSASVPLHPEGASRGSNAPRSAEFAMSVRFQRNIAVEIDVPGARAPRLAVTGVEPRATAQGVALGVHIANEGNAFAHGNGVIRVADTKTDFDFKIDTFVSHTAIVYPMQWTKSVVPGSHHVQVDLEYEGGRRTTWNGTVDIAGSTKSRLQNDLHNLEIRPEDGLDPTLLVAGLIALGFIGGAIALRRRSRRPALVKY
jgi:hypothetical protein